MQITRTFLHYIICFSQLLSIHEHITLHIATTFPFIFFHYFFYYIIYLITQALDASHLERGYDGPSPGSAFTASLCVSTHPHTPHPHRSLHVRKKKTKVRVGAFDFAPAATSPFSPLPSFALEKCSWGVQGGVEGNPTRLLLCRRLLKASKPWKRKKDNKKNPNFHYLWFFLILGLFLILLSFLIHLSLHSYHTSIRICADNIIHPKRKTTTATTLLTLTPFSYQHDKIVLFSFPILPRLISVSVLLSVLRKKKRKEKEEDEGGEANVYYLS